ncbi:Guanine nucleotide-binding protein subunit beta-2 [Armadillidium vulgare]|nr:Guanine nucleotide-binding protein subunit beta-2 [Armadillidium vulgare]
MKSLKNIPATDANDILNLHGPPPSPTKLKYLKKSYELNFIVYPLTIQESKNNISKALGFRLIRWKIDNMGHLQRKQDSSDSFKRRNRTETSV